MNQKLRENEGLPRSLLYVLATIAGLSVANLYYNQPLLHVMGPDLGCGEAQTARIALLTQVGYALGLFFIVPLADLYSRRRIITVDLGLLVIALLAMALAPTVRVAWVASVVIGMCSVVPQIFVPLAAQYSAPVLYRWQPSIPLQRRRDVMWVLLFQGCLRVFWLHAW